MQLIITFHLYIIDFLAAVIRLSKALFCSLSFVWLRSKSDNSSELGISDMMHGKAIRMPWKKYFHQFRSPSWIIDTIIYTTYETIITLAMFNRRMCIFAKY